MSSVRAIFFDLDDTLFDHRRTSLTALATVVQENPVLTRAPFAELSQAFLDMIEEMYPDVLRGQMTPHQARARRFCRLYALCGADLAPAAGDALAHRYVEVYQANRAAVPGAAALLAQVSSRFKVAIVTNNFMAEQQDKLRHLGLAPHVHWLVTSEEVGTPKPARPIFDTALQRAGCRPEEAVMVGDSWSSDVVGAYQAGIRPIWFNPAGRPRPDAAIPCTEIRSLEPATALPAVLANDDG